MIIALISLSKHSGLGHYHRINSLRSFIPIHIFASTDFNQNNQININDCNWEDEENLINLISLRPRIIIIDAYLSNEKYDFIYQYASKSHIKLLIFIDFNPTYYMNLFKGKPLISMIYSPYFALLPSIFRGNIKMMHESKERLKCGNGMRTITLNLGGSDILTPLASQIILYLSEHYHLNVISGINKDKLSKFNINLIFNVSQREIINIYLRSSIIITHAGYSLLETLTLPIKVIAFSNHDNQYDQFNLLKDKGLTGFNNLEELKVLLHVKVKKHCKRINKKIYMNEIKKQKKLSKIIGSKVSNLLSYLIEK